MAHPAVRRATVIPLPRRPGADALPGGIVEPQLYRPAVRPGVAPRPELLDRLRHAGAGHGRGDGCSACGQSATLPDAPARRSGQADADAYR